MESGDIDLDGFNGNNTANEIPKEEPPSVTPVLFVELTDSEEKFDPENVTNLNNPVNLQQDSTMVKQKGENDIDDGAQERMLNDENKITPNKNVNEVNFIPENGVVKIDMEAVKQTLSGMTKEELMKYANDPFWVRLRWALFILFWAIWVAMLVGAIVIIVKAPKCVSIPKKCWEKSPMVHLDLKEHQKKLSEVEGILNTLAEKNIYAISLASIFESDAYGVKNFTNVQFGTFTDVENIMKAGKKNNQCIMLEIDPNRTSKNHPWFLESSKTVSNMSDYYIWSNSSKSTSTQKTETWDGTKKLSYYHKLDSTKPDLNSKSENVIAEMEKILKFWLEKGFQGFRFVNIKSNTDPPRTEDLVDNVSIMKRWKKIVMNETKNQGLFSLLYDRTPVNKDLDDDKVIDLPQNSKWDSNITDLRNQIDRFLSNGSWPGWNFVKDPESTSAVATNFKLMTLLLPGTPIFDYSDELVTGNFSKKFFSLRNKQMFLNGMKEIKSNNNTLAYTRVKRGEPAYLVAFNNKPDAIDEDYSSFQHIPETITIVADSAEPGGNGTKKSPTKGIKLSKTSTVLFRFVPNFKE